MQDIPETGISVQQEEGSSVSMGGTPIEKPCAGGGLVPRSDCPLLAGLFNERELFHVSSYAERVAQGWCVFFRV